MTSETSASHVIIQFLTIIISNNTFICSISIYPTNNSRGGTTRTHVGLSAPTFHCGVRNTPSDVVVTTVINQWRRDWGGTGPYGFCRHWWLIGAGVDGRSLGYTKRLLCYRILYFVCLVVCCRLPAVRYRGPLLVVIMSFILLLSIHAKYYRSTWYALSPRMTWHFNA